jgi:hypothetical protein
VGLAVDMLSDYRKASKRLQLLNLKFKSSNILGFFLITRINISKAEVGQFREQLAR